MDSYEDKVRRERRWYTEPAFQPRHFLNSRFFYSSERNTFNYVFPKKRVALLLSQILKSEDVKNPSVLIAPIGTGDDIQYIRHLAGSIAGIDLSREALDFISDENIETHVGDMKNMTMFTDSKFDVVLSPLFFHHFVEYGFDDFLKEALRVLKPGGHFLSLEQSSLHPVFWMTWCIKKIVGNITGQVDDERPFNPVILSRAMKRCDFHNVQVIGASFSHNRIPIWIARINNVLTRPLLRLPFIKYCAWMCLFIGEK